MIWGAGGMAASLAIIAGCLSTGESKGGDWRNSIHIHLRYMFRYRMARYWLGEFWIVAYNDMFLMMCSFIPPRSHHSVPVHRQMASVQ